MIKGDFDTKEQWTNDLSDRTKDDIILEFAYSVLTSSKGSKMNRVRDDILKIWKGDGLDLDISLSSKALKRACARCASSEEDVRKIVKVLEEGASSDTVLCVVSFSVFVALSKYIREDTGPDGGLNSRAVNQEENELMKLVHGGADINWSKARAVWGSAVAYIRTFLRKEVFADFLDSQKAKLPLSFTEVVDIAFCDKDEMCWFVKRSGLREDKLRITQYNSDADYFKLCLSKTYERLIHIQDRFLLATAAPEFGSYRGYALCSFWDDVVGMRSGEEKLLEDEMRMSPVAAEKPEKRKFAPPDESYLDFYLAKGALKVVAEYSRMGVDILSVARMAAFPKNEITAIVKEAFLTYEIWLYGDCKFTSKKDREAVSELIVRMWLVRSYNKQISKLDLEGRKPAKAEGASKLKKQIDELAKENESLKRRLSQVEAKHASDEVSRSALNKDLRTEISELKSALADKERELLEKDKEKEELMELFRLSDEEEALDLPNEEGLSEEGFRSYINEHKVLVWGLRDETAQKYQKMFPALSFFSSDRRITRQQLESYDLLIMATNYTSHGAFWAARDTAKASGIPMAYLEKTANSPESLYRALDIAAGAGAAKLHE